MTTGGICRNEQRRTNESGRLGGGELPRRITNKIDRDDHNGQISVKKKRISQRPMVGKGRKKSGFSCKLRVKVSALKKEIRGKFSFAHKKG